MLALVIRKIISNIWKVLCLLLGAILVVGMVCSIPIYSSGILQRMLTKDLEKVQTDKKSYPGYIVLSNNFYISISSQTVEFFDNLRKEFSQLLADMPADPKVTLESLQCRNLYTLYEKDKSILNNNFMLCGLTGLESHVRMVKGRMYDISADNDVIEAVMTNAALKKLNMLLDHEYEVYSYKQKSDEPPLFTIRIVGMFTSSDNQDLYWYKHIDSFSESILIDPDLLKQLMAVSPALNIGEQQMIAAYDYYRFHIRDIDLLQGIVDRGTALSEKNTITTRFVATFASIIKEYKIREAELKLTLQILIVPIVLMLILYIFMVSQLMVRSEASVISVLESRGAGRSQILAVYGIESLVYGFVTLMAGPLLGLWMVRIIGAANGFMEFVNRKTLSAEIDIHVMVYALATVLLFMVTLLIPVFMQSKTSIVEQKRKTSRASRAPFWKRTLLDVILLIVSIYALYRMNAQIALQKTTGMAGTEVGLDFLLFLSSTVFILGSGLLFLRLYPLIVKLVYLIGRRFWNPMFYASFHQIIRSSGQEQFLMLFLILALSIGLFNANAARTINRNTEDSILCEIGADIILQERWIKYDAKGTPISESDRLNSSMALGKSTVPQVIKYHEPDFDKYLQLDGVESAARVFRMNEARISKGSARSGTVNLMAVDPHDFALTTWKRSDLNDHYMNEYMNGLTKNVNTVILSSNLRDELGLKVGDDITYSVNNSINMDGVVIAFVDYWPGFQPISVNSDGLIRKESLLVANFEYLLSKTSVQPYEVWIRRTSKATDEIIYDAIKAGNINVTGISSATRLITSAKNDPLLQGTNGALTLGFIVSMLICAAGFLIYWIMSVQGRVLQFGVFRAMGLSRSSVIGILVSEQFLVSGAAILVGVLIGNLSSLLFVPLFQLAYRSVDQPIPFRIMSEQADSTKIFLVLGFVLLVCFIILTRLILKIKIDQAVKLGEE